MIEGKHPCSFCNESKNMTWHCSDCIFLGDREDTQRCKNEQCAMYTTMWNGCRLNLDEVCKASTAFIPGKYGYTPRRVSF